MKLDAHQHFWTYDPMDFGWIADDMRTLRQDFLPTDLRREMLQHGIAGTVVVAALQKRTEIDWLIEQADTYDFIRGIVGWLPLTDFYIDDLLETYAAEPRFLGVIYSAESEISPFCLRNVKLNEGIEALGKYNLTLDLVIQERQMQELAGLVDRHPHQRFVLDHLGKPRIHENAMLPWRENIKAVARRPNVWCKLSGLVSLANQRNWTEGTLRPYMEVALDAFGPDRLIFGSDWPKCLTSCKYSRWYEAVAKFISTLSADEQAKVMGGSAAAAYNLKQTAAATPEPAAATAAAVTSKFTTAPAATDTPSPTMQMLRLPDAGTCEVAEVPRPVPGAGEVLLKVRKVALLPTDLLCCQGGNPLAIYPLIPGHAVAASVVDAASDVPDRFTVGMSVTVYPYTHCGSCGACRRGRFHACAKNTTMGINAAGALTEYIALPWQRLVSVPPLEVTSLALIGPLATGFHAIDLAHVAATETVLILGCDLTGLGAIAAAVTRGARVVAVDSDDRRLAMARKMGALCCLNPHQEDISLRLRSATDGFGPDVAVIVAGGAAAFRLAVTDVAAAGRIVCLDVPEEELAAPPALMIEKELTILGSSRASEKDYETVSTYLRRNTFPVAEAAATRATLAGAAEALAAWAEDPAASLILLIDVTA